MKYQDYVLLGARDVSWKQYSKFEGEFASDPKGCFLSAFIGNRLSAADDISKRFEEFEELVIKVIDNQIDITSEKLSEEKALVTKLSKKYEDERDIFVLLTAYSLVLSQWTRKRKLSKKNTMMVDRVCSAMENADADWEKIMTACILWFSDKDNYREKVQKKYSEIKDSPEYKNRPKTSFETYVKVGAKLCSKSDDCGSRFMQFILLHRDNLAKSIATRFPEFKDVCDLIDETNTLIQNGAEYTDSFVAEFDLLWQKFEESNDLAQDLDFLILASAITSFMGRFNSPEENDGKMIIETIEQHEDEIYGIVRIALYCSALWFADYRNYQELLIKETGNDIADTVIAEENINASIPADDKNAKLAKCLLENNWEEALKILHNRLDDDPSDLEAKVILAEVYKMSQQPEEGIKYGLEAYEEIKGKHKPDDVVGMVFTVSDLLGTISNCYFQLKEYDKAREFADNAESVIGHPTSDTVHVMLHSVYELEGLDAMQKMAEDRYALLSPDMYPDSFAMLKIETARIYFMAIMEYCDQETLQLPEKPLKLLMELAKQVVKMHENLEEVPDEFKDNERFNDLSTLRRQLLFQASTKLYIGNGDINHPEIVSNKQYAGAELCFKCLSLLEEMGEAQVYHLLGLLYRFGAGVEADEKKSFEYLKLSAEKSDTPTDSKALLADCYYEGIGTEKDYEKAYELAMPLAENGVGLPQKIIGLMYYKGEGVSQDKDKGLYWLKKAASNGVEGAKAFLIQEAADNIDDYDGKIAFLQDFSNRIAEDYESAVADKSDVVKYVRYFSEVEKYIVVGDKDIMNFIAFCTESCPECLYKNGYIQPEYYVEMIKRYVNNISEYDPNSAKDYMDMLKDYNFTMISINEFVSYLENEIYKDILTNETNWSNIERLIDDFLREKGYDIPDKDLGVLSASIAMGTDAFIVYSYSLNAVQLLDQVQKKLEYIYWGSNGYRCQLTRTKLMVNGVFSLWSYNIIENDKDHFAAIVFYLIPGRGDETEAEWNMKCNNMVALQLYFEREFRLDQGAIERITIPPHKEAFDNNGFIFIHSDVEAAYNGSKVLLEPYKTTIHNSSDNPPSWYKTGCTASSWSGAKRGNTAGFGGGNYGTGGSSTGGKPIGKYLLIAGVVILALIIIPNLFKSNRSYDDSYYDDEYYDDEYYDEENSDSYNESDSDDYIDEEYPDNGNDSYYVIGNTYQIQTNLRVREGPGKEYRILNRDELTGDDFANSVDSKTTTDALMEKGKYVKCLGMEGDWMRIESGWICVYDEGEVLVR